jgi:transposase InsO family protein
MALYGWKPKHLDIYTQSKSFLNTELFDDWFKDPFLPIVEKRRKKCNYQGNVVLILDNWSAHRGEAFQQKCYENGIVPLYIPPHSSNQLQSLDLCTFGLTKKILRYNNMAKSGIQTRHIRQVLDAFSQAARPETISASFGNARISKILRK